VESFARDGLVFDVLDSGPAGGDVVVLLHGFPQFADSWNAVTPALAAGGYRCLAPNQRGYSAGARPQGRRAYRIGELVEDVVALIDASGARRAHVVGHDWGAAVAWAVAVRHPDRLVSLTALSVPHPAAFVRALVTSRQVLASWYMYFFQLPWLPERIMLGRSGRDGRRLARFLVRSRQSPEVAERDARAMIETDAFTSAVNWYRAMFLSSPRGVEVKVSVRRSTSGASRTPPCCARAPRRPETGSLVRTGSRFSPASRIGSWMSCQIRPRRCYWSTSPLTRPDTAAQCRRVV
jgi:pimeloyl-ACP methyl ester carboxylesterase